MPITFDNVGTSFTSGTTCSVNFTFTAGANTVLLVYTVADVGRSCSAVAYAGVQLTQLIHVTTNQLWALTAPAAGANTLSVDWVTTGGTGAFRATAVTYLGVKAVGGFGTLQSTTTTGVVINLSLSSTTTDLVAFFAVTTNNVSLTASPGTTRLSASHSGDLMLIGDIAGAATISLSAVVPGSSVIRFIGQPLIFSLAAAVTSPFTLSMLGVGL